MTHRTEHHPGRIRPDVCVVGRLAECDTMPLTVEVRCRAFAGIQRAKAAKALGIGDKALARVGHQLGVTWRPKGLGKPRPHRLIREGSGPEMLIGRLIWKRSPVLFHYWLMFTDKDPADRTASAAPEDTQVGAPALCRRRGNSTITPGEQIDQQGAAGLLWAYTFKCDACRASVKRTSEKTCYRDGHHDAWASYAVK